MHIPRVSAAQCHRVYTMRIEKTDSPPPIPHILQQEIRDPVYIYIYISVIHIIRIADSASIDEVIGVWGGERNPFLLETDQFV